MVVKHFLLCKNDDGQILKSSQHSGYHLLNVLLCFIDLTNSICCNVQECYIANQYISQSYLNFTSQSSS